jgi:signal transduction histidine kinase
MMPLFVATLHIAALDGVEGAPCDACRPWGPERAACVQATPAELEIGSGPIAPLGLDPTHFDDGRFVRLPVFWQGSRRDRPRHSRPEFDDAGWTIRPTRQYPADLAVGAEVLWFRLELDVAPALVGEPLAMAMPHTGAAEVWVDGRKVHATGSIGSEVEPTQDGYGRPFTFTFAEGPRHVVVVRWAAGPVVRDQRIGYTPAFRVMIGRPDDLFAYASAFERDRWILTVASAAFPIALALLHLCLWCFRRRGRGDLIFAAFAFSVAAVTALPLTFELVWTFEGLSWAWAVFRAFVGLLALSMVSFQLHLIGARWSAVRSWTVASGITVVLLAPALSNRVVFMYALVMAAIVLVTFVPMLRKPSTRIHAAGLVTYVAGAAVSVLAALDLITVGPVLINAHVFGVPVLLTGMAIALSWEFADTLRAMERHAAESQRKSRALEEARKRESLLAELEVAYADLRYAQAELVESKRMSAVVRLVAGIAHELNSPLGALGSSLDVVSRCADRIRARLATPEADPNAALKMVDLQAEASATGRDAVARVSELVERLEGFVQLDEAETREVDLYDGLEAAIRLLDLRRGPHVRVVRRFGKLPPLRCRPRALNRVFAELLDNALEAIGANGGVGTIEVTTEVRDEAVVVAVTDDGVGLSEEAREHLFDAGFKRGRRVEMGIGLLAAQRVVSSHDGRIHVRSAPGVGSTFEVILPFALPSEARAATPGPLRTTAT